MGGLLSSCDEICDKDPVLKDQQWNFLVPNEVDRIDKGVSVGTVVGIVVGAVCAIILILGVLWWWGYLRQRDTNELELNGLTGSFTLRQIKNATNNFDVTNKIGEGGFGYKGWVVAKWVRPVDWKKD